MIYSVTIQGVTALLQHRFGESAEVAVEEQTRRVKLQDLSPREQAERVCYRGEDGLIYHPGSAIARAIREAGKAHKEKGSRSSVKYKVPAACIVLDDMIHVLDGDGAPVDDYEVDSRRVVVPATKGAVMRHRPRHDRWSMKFRLLIREDVLSSKLIHQLLVESGQQIGIGDYRPEKGGPFGVFQVTSWSQIN